MIYIGRVVQLLVRWRNVHGADKSSLCARTEADTDSAGPCQNLLMTRYIDICILCSYLFKRSHVSTPKRTCCGRQFRWSNNSDAPVESSQFHVRQLAAALIIHPTPPIVAGPCI